eukprot:TRINITY_DN27315_c0_g1_i2.p1 TRINITY_DN27315_c0_g1~~TRINITY_DN27315_c0_g1_i2.p1  ORF type:complete len:905 (+),score=136.75 TRINITY_DN27315_c0_g1_i2:160-2874(+)
MRPGNSPPPAGYLMPPQSPGSTDARKASLDHLAASGTAVRRCSSRVKGRSSPDGIGWFKKPTSNLDEDDDQRWFDLVDGVYTLVRDATSGGSQEMPTRVRKALLQVIAGANTGEGDDLASGAWAAQGEWLAPADPDERLVAVYGYAGQWGELASFWPGAFVVRGHVWPSLEHYFQASKFNDPAEQKRIRELPTCDQAHAEGKVRRPGRALRADWEEKRDEVMFEGLLEKHRQLPRCMQALARTGGRPIVFGDIHDQHWGIGDGSGKNRYGKLLMRVRETLRHHHLGCFAAVSAVLVILATPVAEIHLPPRRITANNTQERKARHRRAIDHREGTVHWKKGVQLGKGAFGEVHLGLNEVTGELMAVKAINFGVDADSQGRMHELQQEVNLMKSLEHPNIVQYYFSQAERTQYDAVEVHIFMEYVSGGSLLQLLRQFGKLPAKVVAEYLKQILQGMHYLHSSGIVHRDIKGANILLTVEGACKVADFGTSVHIQGESRVEFCGTPAWMAPEVILQTGHDWRCDIWSLGCTVIEMLTASVPWAHLHLRSVRLFTEISSADMCQQLPSEVTTNKVATAFIQLCLRRDPLHRPSAMRLYDHDLLQGGQQHLIATGSSTDDMYQSIMVDRRRFSSSPLAFMGAAQPGGPRSPEPRSALPGSRHSPPGPVRSQSPVVSPLCSKPTPSPLDPRQVLGDDHQVASLGSNTSGANSTDSDRSLGQSGRDRPRRKHKLRIIRSDRSPVGGSTASPVRHPQPPQCQQSSPRPVTSPRDGSRGTRENVPTCRPQQPEQSNTERSTSQPDVSNPGSNLPRAVADQALLPATRLQQQQQQQRLPSEQGASTCPLPTYSQTLEGPPARPPTRSATSGRRFPPESGEAESDQDDYDFVPIPVRCVPLPPPRRPGASSSIPE